MKNLEKEVFSEARKSELVARGLSVDFVAGIIAAQLTKTPSAYRI